MNRLIRLGMFALFGVGLINIPHQASAAGCTVGCSPVLSGGTNIVVNGGTISTTKSLQAGTPGLAGDSGSPGSGYFILGNADGIAGQTTVLTANNNPRNGTRGVQGDVLSVYDGNGDFDQFVINHNGNAAAYGNFYANTFYGSGAGITAGTLPNNALVTPPITSLTAASSNITIGGTSANPTVDLSPVVNIPNHLTLGSGGAGLQGTSQNGYIGLSSSAQGGYEFLYTCSDDNFHACAQGGVFGSAFTLSNTSGGAQFDLDLNGNLGIPGYYSSGYLASYNSQCLTAVSTGTTYSGSETNGGKITGNGFACGGTTSGTFTIPAVGTAVSVPISNQKYNAYVPLTVSDGTNSVSGYTTAATTSASTTLNLMVTSINQGAAANTMGSLAQVAMGNVNAIPGTGASATKMHWSLVVGQFPSAATVSATSVPTVFPNYTNAFATQMNFACMTISNTFAQQTFTLYTYDNVNNGGDTNDTSGTSIASVGKQAIFVGERSVISPGTLAMTPGVILDTKVTSDGGNSNCTVILEGYADSVQ